MKLKKRHILVSLVLLTSVTFQSCIGSFSLTNKVLTWNRSVNNKFVNELVFFAFWVLPVYEVTAVADLLVINSIEFWSGNKPLESSNKIIETEHGNYQILADSNGYKITSPDGIITNFIYDVETNTWSLGLENGEKLAFLNFIDENHVKIINGNSSFVDVELSEEGIEQFTKKLMQPLLASY